MVDLREVREHEAEFVAGILWARDQGRGGTRDQYNFRNIGEMTTPKEGFSIHEKLLCRHDTQTWYRSRGVSHSKLCFCFVSSPSKS